MEKRALLLPVILVAVAGCASQAPSAGGTAFAASDLDSYSRLGLSSSRIETWEDGMRTTGGPGTYEWWYFDFTLDDGSTIVIVYYTKDFTRPQTSLRPFVSFQMDSPDGTRISRFASAQPSDFSSATDLCDVRIGPSTLRGDLDDYALHVEAGDVRVDATLHRTVPSWRPGTGVMVFRKASDHFFAWLPSVPRGAVEGTITVGGVARSMAGVGYHDHNWGDASMLDLIHDWYWGRAQVGEYTVIASYITARGEYGGTPLPLFMLARGGVVIADDPSRVSFRAEDVHIDAFTGKPVASLLVYEYRDGTDGYRVSFHREADINRTRFVDLLPGGQAFLARLAGFDGAYLRFTGPAVVERLEAGAVVETATERSAVWELMYFGHAPAGKDR